MWFPIKYEAVTMIFVLCGEEGIYSLFLFYLPILMGYFNYVTSDSCWASNGKTRF